MKISPEFIIIFQNGANFKMTCQILQCRTGELRCGIWLHFPTGQCPELYKQCHVDPSGTGNTKLYPEGRIWPPQSPDLNPMDYSIWDSLSEKVYKGRTENELKDKIREKWEEISVGDCRKAIGLFKKRLSAVCSQDSGHIEHLFK